jgi:hypothetical protein
MPAKMVLRTAYQSDGPSLWIAGKAGIPAVMLPLLWAGRQRPAILFGLFDDTLRRLLKGLQLSEFLLQAKGLVAGWQRPATAPSRFHAGKWGEFSG